MPERRPFPFPLGAICVYCIQNEVVQPHQCEDHLLRRRDDPGRQRRTGLRLPPHPERGPGRHGPPERLPAQRNDQEIDPERKGYLDTMRREVERTAAIVRNLLDFTRPKEPECKPMSLHKVVEESLSLVGNKLSLNNIEVVNRMSPLPGCTFASRSSRTCSGRPSWAGRRPSSPPPGCGRNSTEALRSPADLGADPYGKGWLFKVKSPRIAADLRNLLSGKLARAWPVGRDGEDAPAERRGVSGRGDASGIAADRIPRFHRFRLPFRGLP